MLGQHQHASETPFKWRFASGPMMARLKWYSSAKKKNVFKIGPPLTKRSG